mmetsp:Transcript_21971/g.62576  ORF Transcript_21971/g.62576 Transcript_21971/m.62576 type:complete len:269 (+) Transcript_21971:1100-1906(+)
MNDVACWPMTPLPFGTGMAGITIHRADGRQFGNPGKVRQRIVLFIYPSRSGSWQVPDIPGHVVPQLEFVVSQHGCRKHSLAILLDDFALFLGQRVRARQSHQPRMASGCKGSVVHGIHLRHMLVMVVAADAAGQQEIHGFPVLHQNHGFRCRRDLVERIDVAAECDQRQDRGTHGQDQHKNLNPHWQPPKPKYDALVGHDDRRAIFLASFINRGVIVAGGTVVGGGNGGGVVYICICTCICACACIPLLSLLYHHARHDVMHGDLQMV